MSDPFEDATKRIEVSDDDTNPVAVDEAPSIATHYLLHPHGELAVEYSSCGLVIHNEQICSCYGQRLASTFQVPT